MKRIKGLVLGTAIAVVTAGFFLGTLLLSNYINYGTFIFQ